MSNRYLTTLASGVQQLITAISQSQGVASALKIISTNAQGFVDESFLPPGIGADIAVIQTTEDLQAGDFVNIYLDGSNVRVRLADADNGRDANGFTKTAVTTGQNASVYRSGLNTHLTGLSAGETYYLSGTAGKIATAPPTFAPGVIIQEMGVPQSSSALQFVDRGFVTVA